MKHRTHKPCPSCGVHHGTRRRATRHGDGFVLLFVCRCGHHWWAKGRP